ncbi:MAG: hypothetical protein FJ135_09380 [Deltaproteobacteria bacterium]|nr:hypothetical protein [Deltaproteobacteria bacterium]
MGAFPAAMAALKKSSLQHEARFVMQTSPLFLTHDRDSAAAVVKDLARHPSTMVFYMGVTELKELFSMLRECYPGALPLALAFSMSARISMVHWLDMTPHRRWGGIV